MGSRSGSAGYLVAAAVVAMAVGGMGAARARGGRDAARQPRTPAASAAAALSAQVTPKRESDAEIIQALRSHLDELVSEDRFSGAVLVAKGDTILFQHAYGYADQAFDAPNRVDTKFNLGSMGKMFTGVSILQLAEAGKLSLDDKLIKDLPDYPNKDVANEVTIYQLLTHTSGLGDFFGAQFAAANMERFQTLESLLPLFVDKPLLFTPGTKWSYSNAGFIVLGLVIQHVAGASYYEYVREHVFKPAGMTETGNWRTDSVVPNQAMGYTRMGPEEPGKMPEPLKTRRMNIFSLQRGGSAGGGYSTVVDLWRFSQALQSGKLLDKKYTDRDMTGQVATGRPGVKYGYGMEEAVVNGVRIVGHGGGGPGINSKVDMYPGLGYTVAVMGNYDPPAAERVSDWLQWQFTGEAIPRAIHLPDAELAKYAGKYAAEPPPGMRPGPGMRLPPISISVSPHGELVLALGPQSHYFVPLAKNQFFDEDVPSARLAFTRDATGRVTGLALTGAGPGELRAKREP